MRVVSKQSMTRRFVLALCLMGALSLGAFLIALDVVGAKHVRAQAVNLSGRQRMLTMRVLTGYLGLVMSHEEAERREAAERLAAAVNELENGHEVLTRGASEQGVPPPDGEGLHALYFGETDQLDASVRRFVADARKALLLSPERLRADKELTDRLLAADVTLIPLLDRAVLEYARRQDAKEGALLRLEGAAFVLSLLLLAFIALFIFRPMRDAILRDRAAIEAANARLERLAARDPLTGALNRLKFDEIFSQLAARAKRYAEPVCGIMCDIDFFKKINDVCGHPVGDDVLKNLVLTLGGRLRETDFLFRWGGEEFLMLLPQTTLAEAEIVAEKLRAAVQAHDFGCEHPVTISLGYAHYALPESVESFVDRMDEALYAAKAGGRNRTAAAPEPEPEPEDV